MLPFLVGGAILLLIKFLAEEYGSFQHISGVQVQNFKCALLSKCSLQLSI